jgi:acetate kinase
MPIDESLINSIKCCLHEDQHIVLDPVLVIECQSSACKQCILDSKEKNIYCFVCKNKHEKKKLLNAPSTNKFVERFIKCSLNDLFEYVDEKLKESFKSLTSK